MLKISAQSVQQLWSSLRRTNFSPEKNYLAAAAFGTNISLAVFQENNGLIESSLSDIIDFYPVGESTFELGNYNFSNNGSVLDHATNNVTVADPGAVFSNITSSLVFYIASNASLVYPAVSPGTASMSTLQSLGGETEAEFHIQDALPAGGFSTGTWPVSQNSSFLIRSDIGGGTFYYKILVTNVSGSPANAGSDITISGKIIFISISDVDKI